MESHILLVFTLLFATTLSLLPPNVSKRYRQDYEYNERTDAFYKLHTETRRAWSADEVCKTEGASLMVPGSHEDIIQVHGMFKRYPDLGQYVVVGDDGRDHDEADEPAIINLSDPKDSFSEAYERSRCDVLTRTGEMETVGCYQQLPFVCKVEAKDAPYDSQCDVLASGYQYSANTSSCYKIPGHAASWNEAYAECRSEGSHLVILNSEAEVRVVHRLMIDAPSIRRAQASWFFYAGFRANKPVGDEPVVWRTVFNETLEQAGYAEWSPGEPNNALNNEYCGTLFKNDGKLNDVFCDHLYAFICEKEVKK